MKNAMKLLSDIAVGLKNQGNVDVACVEVQFYEDGYLLQAFSLQKAIQYIADNITWDEEANWAEADEARVVTL